MRMDKKPELLCPAGDWERLQLAVAYGADAVYLAGTTFGMRAFAGNFAPEELPKVVRYCHDHGVRAHVTVNIMPRNDEADQLPAYLELLNDAGVDALILADLGAFQMAGRYAPRCERHISTSSPSATMPAPSRGLIWAPSGWCWLGSCPCRRSARSAAVWIRRWRLRPSATVPCASATPAAAC